ncbi:hypothetical protein AURDEDRAFT_173724 [Auricularia subglabra TFB-10046 SS5]|uniref:Uncharacterized protein n=1 Tax=Auricularia subglabra (strain TFB-10046 / SS5) TaxID=717982 RepID=J0WVM0_AURST|nr:hypothetical protein AURDEDRAFT_173724 [Auricularia subglabra TFB-10046 SS5]
MFVVDPSEIIDVDDTSLCGSALVKIICINRTSNSILPLLVHKPIYNFAFACALRSENHDVRAPGHHMYDWLDFTHHRIVDAEGLKKLRILLESREHRRAAVRLRVLAHGGHFRFTTYSSWNVLEPKKRETIYRSTAAGPRGRAVRKGGRAEGYIASTGQEGKLRFLRELETDVVFNYMTLNVDDILKEHPPIDIYRDHVGGQSLEAGLPCMKLRDSGKIVAGDTTRQGDRAAHDRRLLCSHRMIMEL